MHHPLSLDEIFGGIAGPEEQAFQCMQDALVEVKDAMNQVVLDEFGKGDPVCGGFLSAGMAIRTL